MLWNIRTIRRKKKALFYKRGVESKERVKRVSVEECLQ